MNDRERFLATLKFQELDRYFRWEAPAVWPATVKQWHEEGLPEHIECSNITNSEVYDYFNMDRILWLPFDGSWITEPFYPMFEERVLQDEGERLVIQDRDGILKKIKKEDPDTSMPLFLKFPVSSRDDYKKHIQWRLDWTSEDRFPSNWKDLVRDYVKRDYVLGMFVIGPFGHLRNLMGDETLMYTLYDDPSFIHEIMKHWSEFYRGFINLIGRDVSPDFIMIWEDMCYRSGPLISPESYGEFMASYLKDVVLSAEENGVEGIIVDNDGDCRKMLPIYLDCGANAFYPFEVQAGMNIIEIRKEYGNSFTIIGGLNKYALALNREGVKFEVDSKVPFMLEQGGYIPMLDHTVPTNVTMEMFEFFLSHIRRY